MIFPKRESNPAVLAKLVERIKMTNEMALVQVLRSGRQADPDGVEVRISRQAVEEAANEIDDLRAQLREWVKANGPGGWIDDLRQRHSSEPLQQRWVERSPEESDRMLAAAFKQGASRDASPPYHVDATGMTREPPHCPTCDCGTPADLVGALQDVVHTDPGPVRAGRSVRQGEPGASIAGFPVVVDPTMPPDQIELRNDGNCPTGDWPHNFATETTERMTKGRCIYCGTPAQRT